MTIVNNLLNLEVKGIKWQLAMPFFGRHAAASCALGLALPL
jgi:hypothetical protein